MYEMGRSHPRHRERFSEQTWLTQEHEDGLLQGIRLRYDKMCPVSCTMKEKKKKFHFSLKRGLFHIITFNLMA